jgi:hypothetical protein
MRQRVPIAVFPIEKLGFLAYASRYFDKAKCNVKKEIE